MENSNRHRRLWRFVPLILWISIIFYASSGEASMANTSGILRPFLEIFFSSEDNIYWANIIIRKIAHLTFYGILAALTVFAFSSLLSDKIKKYWFWLALGLVLIIASLDEINQHFEPTRTGAVSDVLLDCLGGFITLLIIKIFKSFLKNDC